MKWREMKRSTKIEVVSVATVWLGVVVLLFGLFRSEQKQSEPKNIPSSVVCDVFDLSTPVGKQWKGWHPVSREQRLLISERVGRGEAEYFPPTATLECVERNPANPHIGEIVRTEKMEWWRWVEKPSRRVVNKHRTDRSGAL